jgi:DNA-binding PadR family transcriptional regulator
LETKLVKEIQRNVVKNFLESVFMTQLMNESPLSGFDFLIFVRQRYGIVISPGTVYTRLYSLERKGLIKGNLLSGKRVYRLTVKGEHAIKSFLKSKEEIQMFVCSLFDN